MKLNNLLLSIVILFNWNVYSYAKQKNHFPDILEKKNIGLGYKYENRDKNESKASTSTSTSLYFNYFFLDKNDDSSINFYKDISLKSRELQNDIKIILSQIIFYNNTRNRKVEGKTDNKILKEESNSINNKEEWTYSQWLLNKQTLKNNFRINNTFTLSQLQLKNNSINGKYLNINHKLLRELNSRNEFDKNYHEYIATIPLDLLKENTLKQLDNIGFKALIFYTPYLMKDTLHLYIQDKENSKRYTKNKLETLKFFSNNKNLLFLKSTIKLSTPCFYTLSDVGEFKNEKIFKRIKSQFKNNILENCISINFNSTSNLSLTDSIHDNNNSSYIKNNNSNLLQMQSYHKEVSTNVKGEEGEMNDKVKLYSRSYTLDDEEKEEEDSGLLVLWIVLGIIGFMSGFIILSYIVNYILYNHRDHLMGNHNPDENYDGTVNPMPLDFMSFGHSPPNLSKKELDQCPIFRFKAINKKHQYKNSNSSRKINLPYFYNKNILKPKTFKENSLNPYEMCNLTDRTSSVDNEKIKKDEEEGKEEKEENDSKNYKENPDSDNSKNNNNSSIRYIFDDSFISDDQREYPSSIKSASITSSYSDIFNHLSFNPDTSSSAEICAICIDQYQLNDELRKLPCGHEFHKECIDSWMLTSSVLCPICKMDIHDYFVKKEQRKKEREKTRKYRLKFVKEHRNFFTKSNNSNNSNNNNNNKPSGHETSNTIPTTTTNNSQNIIQMEDVRNEDSYYDNNISIINSNSQHNTENYYYNNESNNNTEYTNNTINNNNNLNSNEIKANPLNSLKINTNDNIINIENIMNDNESNEDMSPLHYENNYYINNEDSTGSNKDINNKK